MHTKERLRPFAAAAISIGILVHLAGTPARAEPVNVKISYSASLAGLPVGKAKIEATLNGNEYAISGSGRVSGISALFTDGKGTASVTGTMQALMAQPVRYTHTIVDDEKESLSMTFSSVGVSDITIVKPPKSQKVKKARKNKKKKQGSQIIPVTDSHKRSVIDPLSVFLLPVSDLTGGGICDRTLPLFDGKQRFDVVMSFDRKARKDNADAYVCSLAYQPIAGHKPNKRSIKFMANNKQMEIWLVPVGESGFAAPVEARVKTQIGMLVIKATKIAFN